MNLEEVTYSALLALGFGPSHIIPKERIPINEKMFKRMNPKVGDCILYFLFSHINPQQAHETFRDCFPIYDKKMESQFRSAAFDWFKKLNQNEELNIKPNMVVSKVTVMPTSGKFLHTVYTLCRFALQAKILKRDPTFEFLFLPSLMEPKLCQKQVQVFTALKTQYKDIYINSIGKQKEKLQALRSTALSLISRFRNNIKMKNDLLSEQQSKLKKSAFLEPQVQNALYDCSLNQFENDILTAIKEKNKEIKQLWDLSATYRLKEEESWALFENVITGKKSLPYIDGNDYKSLERLSPNCYFLHSCSEPLSIHINGAVDLLSLIKVGNAGLSHLLELSKEHFTLDSDLKDQLKKSENQANCVKTLKEDREEVQAMLNSTIPSLLQSVIELKENVNSESYISVSSKEGNSFELCPPTPHLNIEKNTSCIQSLQTPYRLIELTPERPTIIKGDDSQDSFNLKSVHRRDGSKHLVDNECMSPYPRGKRKTLINVESPAHLTPDSGCVVSCGTDTLLLTLDKLDITPQRNRRLSFSRRKSARFNRSKFFETSSVNSTCKDESLAHRLTSSTQNLNNYENSLNMLHKSFDNDSRINNNNNTNTNNNNNNNNSSRENDLEKHLCTPQREFKVSHLCEKECTDIIDLSESIKITPQYNVTHSPLISQVLKDMKSSETPSVVPRFQNNGSYCSLSKKIKEFKKSEAGCKLSEGFKSSLKKKSVNFTPMMTKETIKHNESDLDSSSVFSSSKLNLSTPRSDTQRTLLSCVSSLESLLSNDEEDKVDGFQFKIISDLPRLSSVKEDLHEDFQVFEDGKKFFENREEEEDTKKVPKESVFQTLTESAVSGELETNFILDESVDAEIRRESLNISFRDSVLKMGRRESGGFPTLSTIVGRLSMEGENILDQSDSCLLSVSSDTL